MDKIIAGTLGPDETVLAHTWGKMDMWALGGPLFPSQGILVATERRILYFEKTHHVEMEFVREVAYEDVERFAVYPDIMHGLAGIIAKVLLLQPVEGEPIRLVGPVEYQDFARVLKSRAKQPVKGRVW